MNEIVKKIKMYTISTSFYPERAIFIPYYLQIGLRIDQIIMIQIIVNVIQGIFEIPSGILADKFSKNKILSISAVLLTFYYFIIAITVYFQFIVLANILLGIGSSLISGTNTTYIYQVLDKSNNGNKEGILEKTATIAQLTLSISILIGGLVSYSNIKLLFLFAGLFQIASIVILKKMPKDIPSKSKMNEIIKGSLKYFKEKYLLIQMIFLVLFDSLVWFIYIVSQDLLLKSGIENKLYISCIFIFLGVTIHLIISKIRKIKLINTLFSLVLVLIMSGLSSSYLSIFILLLFSQLSYIKVYTSKSILLNDNLNDENRSFIFSTLNAFISITMGLLFYLYNQNEKFIIIFGALVLAFSYLSIKIKK